MAGQEKNISDGLGQVDSYERGLEASMFNKTTAEGALGGLALSVQVTQLAEIDHLKEWHDNEIAFGD